MVGLSSSIVGPDLKSVFRFIDALRLLSLIKEKLDVSESSFDRICQSYFVMRKCVECQSDELVGQQFRAPHNSFQRAGVLGSSFNLSMKLVKKFIHLINFRLT